MFSSSLITSCVSEVYVHIANANILYNKSHKNLEIPIILRNAQWLYMPSTRLGFSDEMWNEYV